MAQKNSYSMEDIPANDPASRAQSGGHLNWKFSQCFGEKAAVDDLTDADILSAVEFDATGEYLATGDKGGRVVIFQQSDVSKSNPKALVEYNFHTEFQSHEPEFDYLKSLEIEEKINAIRWCRPACNALFLLTTNDKTIKLWKVHSRKLMNISDLNLPNDAVANGGGSVDQNMDLDADGGETRVAATHPPRPSKALTHLKVPKTNRTGGSATLASPRRVFANAHAYHINSISPNSDGVSFLSADDLRINLWHMDHTDQSFNVVDMKPENMEELTEVITAASFHPSSCNTFMYSSSRGSIKLGDMRQAALCDEHAKIFDCVSDEQDKSFFSEIIASISDVQFSYDGRYIFARDYLTLKIWDVRKERKPTKVIHIHDKLHSKLCDLYENDCIFDKFQCTVDRTGQYLATGSYHSVFHVYEKNGETESMIECSKDVQPVNLHQGSSSSSYLPIESIDFGKKALHLSWHPKKNAVAVAGLNNLYIYSAT
eukprot:g2754.t1